MLYSGRRLDIDYFISSILFGMFGAVKYLLGRNAKGKDVNYLHCSYCALAGNGILIVLAACAYLVEDGRALVESSSQASICFLAGMYTLAARSHSTFRRLINM